MNPVEKIKDWSQRSTQFYGDVRSEVKKVSWPGKNEIVGTTVVVIVAVFFFGVYLGLVDYMLGLGLDRIGAYEASLLEYGTRLLSGMSNVRIIGTASQKSGILSFVMDGVHPHDVGTILDAEGIAIRTGHHCAQPVMQRFGIPATARASFAFYNTREEIDALVKGLDRVSEVFG